MIMPVLAIGPHMFACLPLSLQKITETTKANWPAIARFGVAPARQFTGLGEDEFEVEGLMFHDEWGGMGDYLALKATQRIGIPVPLIGWGAAAGYALVFGDVVVLDVGATHEHIGFAGVGRKMTFTVKLGAFGGDGFLGGLF